MSRILAIVAICCSAIVAAIFFSSFSGTPAEEVRVGQSSGETVNHTQVVKMQPITPADPAPLSLSPDPEVESASVGSVRALPEKISQDDIFALLDNMHVQQTEEVLSLQDFRKVQSAVMETLYRVAVPEGSEPGSILSLAVRELGIDEDLYDLLSLSADDQVLSINGIKVDELMRSTAGGSLLAGTDPSLLILQAGGQVKQVTIRPY